MISNNSSNWHLSLDFKEGGKAKLKQQSFFLNKFYHFLYFGSRIIGSMVKFFEWSLLNLIHDFQMQCTVKTSVSIDRTMTKLKSIWKIKCKPSVQKDK